MIRPRPVPARLLAGLVTALVGCFLCPVPSAQAADEAEPTPLTVRLVRLAPATIPANGSVTLAGTVQNTSDEDWGAINVYPFASASPMTTRDELAAAADSPADTEVGTRLVDPGQFAAIGDLGPGESTRFLINVPAEELPHTAGVYWIGVHALGQNADGRDTQADGRARTFIPSVKGLFPTTAHTDVSLVIPLRERVRRDARGRLLDTTGWSETLGPDGRLGRIGDFLDSAANAPATLLVDPAVIEAVESVAADNPELSFGTTPDDEPTETPSPGEDPTDGPSGNTASRALDRLDATDREHASDWLTAVTGFAAAHAVLGLGYADPDTSSLARRKPTMLARATRLSAETLERLAITAAPAVAPPDGWLDDEALSQVDPDSVVLVSDHGAPRTRTHWKTSEGQDLVFTDAETSSGGPAPTAPLDALALRQRILADAALRTAEGTSSPLVVQLPADWDPGPGWESARFFETLDQPWLRLRGLTRTSDPATPSFDAALGYPAEEQKAEIGSYNIAAARQLIITGTTLRQVLRSQNNIEHVVSGIALTGVSYSARVDATRAADTVLATNESLRSRMGSVEVVGTDFVTLSGGSGTLAVTLVNGLDQPVTVGVAPTSAGDGVRISAPDPLELAPGERTVLRLRAKASAIGVHEVTLTPVSATGLDLGTPLTLSLRTSEVGNLIWYVLLAGGALLVVMIGRRVLRGLREHRWRGQ